MTATPGTVFSLFGSHPAVHVDGANWLAGRSVACPQTGFAFSLPQTLPPLTGTLAPTLGRAFSPYAPGEEVRVPPDQWKPGGTVVCPKTRQPFLLPASLPPLVAPLLEGRVGMVRSPYTGEVVQIEAKDWVAGHEIACPPPYLRFLLPASLPEWIAEGSIADLPPGQIRSPYNSVTVLDVPAAQWIPGGQFTCPATGRPFKLPGQLGLLEGVAKAGAPGRVLSPFSGKWQAVPIEDWKAGRKLKCLESGMEFILPAGLEEWIVDGNWVPGAPGRIGSPFRPFPKLDIPAGDWKSGGLLVCPSTKRRFRIPTDEHFPSLQLEKAAVQYARAEPRANEDAATLALERQHAGVTPEQVLSIWKRHGLETVEKRVGTVGVGEIIADAPCMIRSPYGQKPEFEVPPERWVEPGATLRCPETGLPFVLPGNLPPLRAVVDPADPGMVVSPFAPSQPFQMPPQAWKPGQMVECPYSGHSLQLPLHLPEWNPTGTVKEGEPGQIISPLGAAPRHEGQRTGMGGWRHGCLHLHRLRIYVAGESSAHGGSDRPGQPWPDRFALCAGSRSASAAKTMERPAAGSSAPTPGASLSYRSRCRFGRSKPFPGKSSPFQWALPSRQPPCFSPR